MERTRIRPLRRLNLLDWLHLTLTWDVGVDVGPEMRGVELLALGRCDLRVDGVEARDVVSQPKRFGLLAYLALARPPGLRQRDELIALLWPELSERRARQALSQSLYFLATHLGPDVVERGGKSLVGIGPGLESDVRRFERAIEEGHLGEGLKVYGGELLPGLHVTGCRGFEQWLEGERRRLRDLAAKTAGVLSERCAADGRPAEAVRWARWALRRHPYDEAAAVRLLLLYAVQGDDAAIRREYGAFARRMREDLELEPGPRLRELVPPPNVAPLAEGPALEGPVAGGPTPTESHAPPPTDPRTAGRPSHRAVLAGGFAAICLVALVGSILRNGPGDPLLSRERARVLVMPFEVTPADSALRSVARLTSDWIAREVAASGIADVVAPSTASARAPSPTTDSLVLADLGESGSSLVVSGRLRRTGDELGIEVTIGHAASQEIAMTLPVRTGPRDEATALVEDVGNRTTAALATLLDERLGNWAEVSSQPPSMSAYRAFLDGLDWFVRADADSTDHYLLAAAESDPDFTAPLIWAVRSRVWFHRIPAADSLAQALQARRDDLAPWDRAMLDYYVAYLRGTWEEAYQAARRVERVALDPEWSQLAASAAQAANRPRAALAALERIERNAAWARDWPYRWRTWTIVLHQAGDFEAELAAAAPVRSEHPIATRMTALGAYAGLGRLDAFAATLEELRELVTGPDARLRILQQAVEELRAHGYPEPARPLADEAIRVADSLIAAGDTTADARHRYGDLLSLAGRWREAYDVLSSIDRDDTHGTLLVSRARAAARLGLESEARATVAALATDDPLNKGHEAYRGSVILAALGDRAGATRLLRQAIADGFGHYEFVHRIPEYETLAGYPPYEELMRPLD